MRTFIYESGPIEIVLAGLAFFLLLYFGFGAVNIVFTRWVFPFLKIGKRISNKHVKPEQYWRECRDSVVSIAIFSGGLLIPWGLIQLGWVGLAVRPSGTQIIFECVVLLLWNEVHFYINHRLLHTSVLRRFHTPHHRSVVTTPWTTYSLHPIEAMMVGNVIIWPMLLHDFSIEALIALPVMSLVINSASHSNYDFGLGHYGPFSRSSLRHSAHHAFYNGNYGFTFGFMDALFGTSISKEKIASMR